MEPLVSIIIPLYNREKLLSQTLDSILKQTYKNWECIVVDDHSTDNSLKIAQEYGKKDHRFKSLKRPNDRTKGANACRNYGFEVSKGDLINWFDSDDIMHQDFLLKSVNENNGTQYNAVISKALIFENDIETIIGKENRTKLTANIIEDFIRLRVAWYLQGVVWQRSFLKDKTLFDEDLLAGQDRDFHTRILLHNPDIKILDEYLFYYRKHSDSITASVDDIKNAKLKISHLYSVVKLVDKLKEADKLSVSLKSFLFSSMMKYLPFVINDKRHYKTLINVLKKISVLNGKGILNWVKFYLSYLSFKVLGRGSKLLK